MTPRGRRVYLVSTKTGDEAKAMIDGSDPLAPYFSGAVVAATEKVELWHSNLADVGAPFNEWRVFDAEGRLMSKIQRKSG